MDDMRLKLLNRVLVDAFTKYQGAVLDHGVKDLADILKKSKSTIYAEISIENLATYLDTIQNYDEKKPAYLPKLGLVDFLIGVFVSGDKRAFVALASFLNMACYEIPSTDQDKADWLDLLQGINKEHFESGREVLEALKDNRINVDEARAVSREAMDLINATSILKHAADARIKRG